MGTHHAAAVPRCLVRAAALALAAFFMLVVSPLSAQQPRRIIAVGDLHGDFDAWTTIARAAGVIDAAGHWAGGKTILVQMGDVLDREPDSLKIIRNLQQLQAEAPRSGGNVFAILGNHEAMNVIGDNRYTTPGEYGAFADAQSGQRRDRIYELNRARIEAAAQSADAHLTPQQIRANWIAQHPLGWVEHRIAWGANGELGKWAARNPAVLKVDGTLFAHGGVSAEYAKLPLDEVNRRAAAAIAAGAGDNTILDDPLGPLWYRGLAVHDADADTARTALKEPLPRLTVDQELTAVLSAYGAQRIVIAHTPILSGIAITNGGRLARVDTGISRYYGGPLSWLEIVGSRMIPHQVKRTAP